MAECFISTTTPGKLRGLTPEIGMLKALERWEHIRTKCFYSTARPAKLAFAGRRQMKTVVFVFWGPGAVFSQRPLHCQTMLRGSGRPD